MKFMQDVPDSFAFYNGGPLSGASIPHRHMQFLPFDDVQSICPIQGVLDACPRKEGLVRLPCFPFVHGLQFLNIPEDEPKGSFLARTLRDTLDELLKPFGKSHKDCCIEHTPQERLISYNLVWTSEWMLVVPRRQEKAVFTTEQGEIFEISVNSVAMAGYLLAKSPLELNTLQHHGPIQVLQQLCYPL